MGLLRATLLCVFLAGAGSSYAAEDRKIHLPAEKHLLPLPGGEDPRRVRAPGRIIKYLDYDENQDGVPDERAIYMACSGVLASTPFLVHSLRPGTLAIDLDGDGKAELRGRLRSSRRPGEREAERP